jgi:hypothetical protein
LKFNLGNESTKVLDEFLSISRDIISVYFDAITGFDRNLEWMNNNQKKSVEYFKGKSEDITIAKLDEAAFIYGDGNPNLGMPEIFHYATQKEYKDRNKPDERNYKFIGNMCLITIYQYWEDNYREKLANTLSLQKDAIKSDLFGDIAIIRNSIIHNNSVASSKVNKCKILKWFQSGDRIFINQDMLKTILRNIQKHKLIIEFPKKEA